MRLTALLVLLLALPALAEDKQPPASKPVKREKPAKKKALTLDGLLKQFKGVPGLFAEFKEEKRMALLAAPLVNSGTIHYAPPERMARHTLKPSRSTVLIDKRSLKMSDGKRAETIDFKRNPVARQFVDSFLPILRGDKRALEKMYRLRFKVRSARQETWELLLEPRLSPMNKAIKSIRFRGQRLVMQTMTVTEVGGDTTLTTFSKVDVKRRYSKKELARVFRLPKAGGKR